MARTVAEKKGGQHSARGALELTEHGARIAILTRHKGRPMIGDLIEVAFPTPPAGQTLSPSAKAAALREALRSRGWRPREMVLVLPKNMVTLRLVTLPSTHDAELAEMARFEAQKHIPFNVERHVISHAILRKEDVEGSLVLIVAVDRAVLEEPLAICREARLDLASACVSSLALVEALLLDPPAGLQEQTFALVNLGWTTVDITIMSGGLVRFTRSGTMGVGRIAPLLEEASGGRPLRQEGLEALDALAPEGFFTHAARPRRRAAPTTYSVDDFVEEELDAPALQAASTAATVAAVSADELPAVELTGPAGEVAKWLGRIVQEIQRTHTFAIREFECPEVGLVYLAGIGSYITNMDKYLEQHMRCPVGRIRPPASIEFATVKDRHLPEAWREFAVAIGAVAGANLPPINLLPPEYTEGIRIKKRRRALAVTGSLVVLLIALCTGYAVRWVHDQGKLLEKLRKENKHLAPKVAELRDKERRLRIVEQNVKDPFSAAAILDTITRIEMVTRRQVALLDYHYIKNEGVMLTGHARGNPEKGTFGAAEVEHFVSELEKTKCFPGGISIKSRSPFPLPTNRGEVTKFDLDSRFSKPAEK